MNALVLDVHVCDRRQNYRVTFEPSPDADQRAADFIRDRWTYCSFSVAAEFDDTVPVIIPGTWEITFETLYPECEHGLSAALCTGPQHY